MARYSWKTISSLCMAKGFNTTDALKALLSKSWFISFFVSSDMQKFF